MPEHHHRHDRVVLAAAGACVGIGLAVLAVALLLLPRSDAPAAAAQPARIAAPATVPTATTTSPSASAARVKRARRRPAVTPKSSLLSQRAAWEQLFADNEGAHVPERWVQGFYPLYDRAQRSFGVNWLLLASIHRQETAFSTASTTYHGLNFAHCCAGPMQFNVKNGPVSTWERFRSAYQQAQRPDDYPHRTRRHPSVYDDYDAMMAAGSLLRYSGAAAALDQNAWRAAYDYYGHDMVGVEYADQVLARAISWSQTGFAINQALDPTMVAAVHAAWGAPVARELEAADRERRRLERRHEKAAQQTTDEPAG